MAYYNRRRFRRNTATWFPVEPTPALTSISPTTGASAATTVAVINDNIDTSESSTSSTPLIGFTRQGYTVVRAVGSIFVSCVGAATANNILCFAGLFSGRASNAGTFAEDINDYNPFVSTGRGIQRRFMWQRYWSLNPWDFDYTTGNFPPPWPSSNAHYGSVREGTHVDSKGSKLRVSLGARLFWLFAAFNLTAETQQIDYLPAIRVLGKVGFSKQYG